MRSYAKLHNIIETFYTLYIVCFFSRSTRFCNNKHYYKYNFWCNKHTKRCLSKRRVKNKQTVFFKGMSAKGGLVVGRVLKNPFCVVNTEALRNEKKTKALAWNSYSAHIFYLWHKKYSELYWSKILNNIFTYGTILWLTF